MIRKGKVRASAMEDSSNGKLEETREVESVNERKDVAVEDVGDSPKLVQIESVKNLEINDENSEPASKRAISILEEIVESAEKVLDGDDSSSSSSSEEETDVPAEEAGDDQVEKKEALVSLSNDLSEEVPVNDDETEEVDGSSPVETEEKTVSSLVEDDVVADLASKGVEETKFQSSNQKNDSSDEAVVTCAVSKGSEEEIKSPFVEQKIDEANSALAEEVSKGIEENNNKTGESSQAVHEAASGNVGQHPEIPENAENPSVVAVTRASLERTSWKSCCGLLEVLRRSDR